jgi:hypothetical protein
LVRNSVKNSSRLADHRRAQRLVERRERRRVRRRASRTLRVASHCDANPRRSPSAFGSTSMRWTCSRSPASCAAAPAAAAVDQLLVGHAAPQEVRQAARQRVVVERRQPGCGVSGPGAPARLGRYRNFADSSIARTTS